MAENSSSFSVPYSCSSSTVTYLVNSTITAIKASLLVPLYVFVVSLGLRQWRQQRSFKSASHSDIFTYHLAAFELIWLFTSGLHLWAAFTGNLETMMFTSIFIFSSWYGENFLHVLTCVERYLAVVHPVVYMRLRNEQGVRIRNISIVCVWILSFVCSVLVCHFYNPLLPIPFLVPFAVCLVAVSFCSLSVLNVLIRPGPGDGGQDREQVDPAKRRAFFTITAILLVLWSWLGGILLAYSLYTTVLANSRVKCVLVSLVLLFNLPSALVLPLLYLHRAGKLSLCFHKSG